MRGERLLTRGRRMAVSRMSDSCVVTRGEGRDALDPVSDEYVSVPAARVYSGVCRVKQGGTVSRDVDAGSALLVVGQLELHVPVGTVVFEPGDIVTVTGCPTRPDQVGRTFTVLAPFDGSQTTALRYRVGVADGR